MAALSVEIIMILLLVLLALTIVVSLQTVGAGLVAAMLVTPAATAQLLTRRLPAMMMTATCSAQSMPMRKRRTLSGSVILSKKLSW